MAGSSDAGAAAGQLAADANRGPRAYSLIEILGVLTVIAILAASLTPALLRQLDEQMRRVEADALGTLAGGLREYILNQRRIPNPAAVFTEVADQIGWPVHTVATNARGQPRLLLVDPAFRIGTNTVANLPYVQGIYGATNLTGLRLLLVSSMGDPLPSVLANPGTNAATVFGLLWDTPDGTQPAGWTWGGDWEDLLVHRINLRPLFTQVILNNNSTGLGRFSLDDTNNHVALPSNPFSGFYFVRSVLGLHGDTGNQGGRLQVRQVLQDVTVVTNASPYLMCPSFVYDEGMWRGRLFMSPSPPRRAGQDLQAAYEIFMSGPPNVYKVGSVNQASVTWSMYMFMSNYVLWAESGFDSSLKNRVVTWQRTMADQVTTYCNKKATAN
jgi:hypothetical protein